MHRCVICTCTRATPVFLDLGPRHAWCRRHVITADIARTGAIRARGRSNFQFTDGRAKRFILWDALQRMYGPTCPRCGEIVDLTERDRDWRPTTDHVVSVRAGGDDRFENLRVAHWLCNSKAGLGLRRKEHWD